MFLLLFSFLVILLGLVEHTEEKLLAAGVAQNSGSSCDGSRVGVCSLARRALTLAAVAFELGRSLGSL